MRRNPLGGSCSSSATQSRNSAFLPWPSMSWLSDIEGHGKNAEFLLCVALDEHDPPSGFLRIVPAYGEDFGYTLDLMRHLPDAPNGMTEYLIAQSALALGQEGIV